MNRWAGGSLLVVACVACGEGGANGSGLSVAEPSTASATTSTTADTVATDEGPGSGSSSGSSSGPATTDVAPTTGPGSTSVGSTDAPTGTASSSASTTSSGDACGDGVLDDGEACDGDALGGMTCTSFGFSGGALACAGCRFDTSGCTGMLACDEAPAAPGAMACPPACTGGCDMNTGTCNINCDNNGCDGATIACPADWACAVSCNGVTACEGVIVNCPAQYACDVVCDGTAACELATFNCASGPCHVTCQGTVTCSGSTLSCGLGDAQLQCDVVNAEPAPVVDVDPLSMCACKAVGC